MKIAALVNFAAAEKETAPTQDALSGSERYSSPARTKGHHRGGLFGDWPDSASSGILILESGTGALLAIRDVSNPSAKRNPPDEIRRAG
jgi:hypothetical protein